MAETKKFIVVDGPINHDHELYQNGDPIELPKKSADRLEREKKVVPAKPEKAQADPGNGGAPAGGKAAGENEGSKEGSQEGKEKEAPKDKLKDKKNGGKK